MSAREAGFFSLLDILDLRRQVSQLAASGKSDRELYCDIIQAFIRKPFSRERFDALFRMTYNHTIAYLIYLKRKGRRLPEQGNSIPEPPADLANDILGMLFASKKGKPFYFILNHFQTEAIPGSDYCDLYEQFRILLGGFIRQELSRINKQENPQRENLKRRFKDILKGAEYSSERKTGSGSEYFFLRQSGDRLRSDKPSLPDDKLLVIVEQAYRESTSRSEWCRKVFEHIDSLKEYQNMILKHELLRAVVTINARYLELDAWQPARLPSPKLVLVRKTVNQARDKTAQWLNENIVADFIAKGRISKDEAACFANATENYLADLGETGETDPIPEYYREVMPECYHARYLKDHKYIFETIIKHAVENFRERLKKDSTIRNLGGYYISDD